mmetsp:Transcript_58662/g.168475  ORF Transcript_58662/g.168475 Transcript_58662/m.168475 type:complete len:321 (-) Transcript_58662:100-1062(-)
MWGSGSGSWPVVGGESGEVGLATGQARQGAARGRVAYRREEEPVVPAIADAGPVPWHGLPRLDAAARPPHGPGRAGGHLAAAPGTARARGARRAHGRRRARHGAGVPVRSSAGRPPGGGLGGHRERRVAGGPSGLERRRRRCRLQRHGHEVEALRLPRARCLAAIVAGQVRAEVASRRREDARGGGAATRRARLRGLPEQGRAADDGADRASVLRAGGGRRPGGGHGGKWLLDAHVPHPRGHFARSRLRRALGEARRKHPGERRPAARWPHDVRGRAVLGACGARAGVECRVVRGDSSVWPCAYERAGRVSALVYFDCGI